MENASKALLMAGGILIALLVISALVLMFNQIGAYGKSQEEMKRNSQLAEFNKDFERYLNDKGITGADVISLINKVDDYNIKAKNGVVVDSIDYSVKMTITISNLDKFNYTYAYSNNSNKMFKLDSYTIGDNNALGNQLKRYLEAERKIETIGISPDKLKQLSGMYDGSNVVEVRKKLIEITNDNKYNNWPNNNMEPSTEALKKYRQYWEFKTSKFVPDGEPIYATNGQITQISVKFYK